MSNRHYPLSKLLCLLYYVEEVFCRPDGRWRWARGRLTATIHTNWLALIDQGALLTSSLSAYRKSFFSIFSQLDYENVRTYRFSLLRCTAFLASDADHNLQMPNMIFISQATALSHSPLTLTGSRA